MKYGWVLLACLVIFPVFATGKYVSYEVDGQKYQGYYTQASDKAPLILMVHDWDGLTEYEVKRANMLTRQGYNVFAVDLFGADVHPSTTEEKRALTGSLYKDREKMRKLLYGGLQAAKFQGGNIHDAVAMGYCFGGAAVLEFARSGVDLKGFATFHGGLSTPEGQDYSKVKGKLLIMHGSADTSVTMADFAKLSGDLEAAHIPNEMITYSGAPHAFTVFGTERYRKDADEKSWRRFGEFLKDTL